MLLLGRGGAAGLGHGAARAAPLHVHDALPAGARLSSLASPLVGGGALAPTAGGLAAGSSSGDGAARRRQPVRWQSRPSAAEQFRALLAGELPAPPTLAQPVSVSATVAGRPLSLEIGRVGPLADAVVTARFGGTSLLLSAVSKWDPAGEGFMPLQVDYRERSSGAGVIPGTVTRREPGATDRETLAARVIDRTVRPLFPKGYLYDTQLICTVTSFDRDCDPAMLSVLAASAALSVSNIPWGGPAAAVRVGWVDGRPVLAPSAAQEAASSLNLLYSATADKTLMLEVGASQLPEADLIAALRFAHDTVQPLLALQAAFASAVGPRPKRDVPLFTPPPSLTEAVRELIFDDARAMYRCHHFRKQQRGNAQRLLFLRLKEELAPGLPPEQARYLSSAGDAVIKEALRSLVVEAATGVPPRPTAAAATRAAAVAAAAASEGGAPAAIASPAAASAAGDGSASPDTAAAAASAAAPAVQVAPGVRVATIDASDVLPAPAAVEAPLPPPALQPVAAPGGRPDGRSSTAIRPLKMAVDVLPAPTHGSALFSRGDTQVLCTATLGPSEQALVLRPAATGGVPVVKPFFLHYDFPPYCTNETGRVGGVNRRMIGHGALAEKALLPVVPKPRGYREAAAAGGTEDAADGGSGGEAVPFPYSIRVTSEVSGSDGSSSMATVCGATLALLDAGVPLAAPVAGISIGVVVPPAPPVPAPQQQYGNGAAAAPQPQQQQQQQPFVLLTDIFGLEDHSGDMDFKIAGTAAGVTAVQLDIKPAGLPLAVLEAALWAGRDARLRVLAEMAALMPGHRPAVKPHAPLVEQLLIPAEYVGRVIGPGGSGIRRLEAATGARVQIERDLALVAGPAGGDAAAAAAALLPQAPGSQPHVTVSIYAPAASMAAAKAYVLGALDEHQRLTGSPFAMVTSAAAPVYAVGTAVTLTVLKLFEFGAVLGPRQQPVEVAVATAAAEGEAAAAVEGAAAGVTPAPLVAAPATTQHEVGWIHISELTPRRSVRAFDLLSEGDEVTALVVDVDSRGRAKVSVRALLQPGEEPSKYITRKGASAAAAAVAPAQLQQVQQQAAADAASTTSAVTEAPAAVPPPSPAVAEVLAAARAPAVAADAPSAQAVLAAAEVALEPVADGAPPAPASAVEAALVDAAAAEAPVAAAAEAAAGPEAVAAEVAAEDAAPALAPASDAAAADATLPASEQPTDGAPAASVSGGGTSLQQHLLYLVPGALQIAALWHANAAAVVAAQAAGQPLSPAALARLPLAPALTASSLLAGVLSSAAAVAPAGASASAGSSASQPPAGAQQSSSQPQQQQQQSRSIAHQRRSVMAQLQREAPSRQQLHHNHQQQRSRPSAHRTGAGGHRQQQPLSPRSGTGGGQRTPQQPQSQQPQQHRRPAAGTSRHGTSGGGGGAGRRSSSPPSRSPAPAPQKQQAAA